MKFIFIGLALLTGASAFAEQTGNRGEYRNGSFNGAWNCGGEIRVVRNGYVYVNNVKYIAGFEPVYKRPDLLIIAEWDAGNGAEWSNADICSRVPARRH